MRLLRGAFVRPRDAALYVREHMRVIKRKRKISLRLISVFSYPCCQVSKEKPESTLQEIVGARIRALRKARGWTQEELGGRADLDFTSIGGAERGERSLSLNSLSRVAAALEVELAWLVRPEQTESGAAGEGLIEELLGVLRDLPERDLQHVVDLAPLEKTYLTRVRG